MPDTREGETVSALYDCNVIIDLEFTYVPKKRRRGGLTSPRSVDPPLMSLYLGANDDLSLRSARRRPYTPRATASNQNHASERSLYPYGDLPDWCF